MKGDLFFAVLNLIHSKLAKQLFAHYSPKKEAPLKPRDYNPLCLPKSSVKMCRLHLQQTLPNEKKSKQFVVKTSQKSTSAKGSSFETFTYLSTNTPSLSHRVTDQSLKEYLLFLSCLENKKSSKWFSAVMQHYISVISFQLDQEEKDLNWLLCKSEERLFQIDRVIRYLT